MTHFLETPTPEEWTDTVNPPYSYYLWYMYANITMINQVRKERGLNCFNLRHPLCSLPPLPESLSSSDIQALCHNLVISSADETLELPQYALVVLIDHPKSIFTRDKNLKGIF